MELNDRVALVTGGSSGIGRATALEFMREGARVAVVDVDAEGGMETVRMIREQGGEACFIRCDVSNPEDVEAMVCEVVETYGRIDCAFNNAGIEGRMTSITDSSIDAWQNVIGVNLTGVFLCMKYEIEQMLKQGGGAIVNNASILGLVGFGNASAYTAAKHGVLGLTKVAAIEYASKGIRVNSVCPAFVMTPMLKRVGVMSDSEVYVSMQNRHAVRRMGQPEEIADVAVWLCTDAASFIHGHSMLADGGYLTQ